METQIKKLDYEAVDMDIIEEAGRVLKEGGLVAFPTETVYGLGGDALNPASSEKIYAAKGRPSDNPLIVHIAAKDDVYRIAKEIPKKAERLMETLYLHFLHHIDSLPEEFRGLLEQGEPREQVVCDYVGAMTDRFAIATYDDIYIPKSWSI